MNGTARIGIEKMLDETDNHTEEKFETIHEKFEELKVSLENAQEKMYDHEFNKKNNLRKRNSSEASSQGRRSNPCEVQHEAGDQHYQCKQDVCWPRGSWL